MEDGVHPETRCTREAIPIKRQCLGNSIGAPPRELHFVERTRPLDKHPVSHLEFDVGAVLVVVDVSASILHCAKLGLGGLPRGMECRELATHILLVTVRRLGQKARPLTMPPRIWELTSVVKIEWRVTRTRVRFCVVVGNREWEIQIPLATVVKPSRLSHIA